MVRQKFHVKTLLKINRENFCMIENDFDIKRQPIPIKLPCFTMFQTAFPSPWSENVMYAQTHIQYY